MRRDMNFVGIYTVIVGALTCLSIIGAIVGVPTLISGLRLREAAIAFDDFAASGNMGAITYALERQQKYFNITKILVIVSLACTALMIVGMMIFVVFFSSLIPR